MARKPSISSLTRQVHSLERQRDDAAATIKRLAGERDAARDDQASAAKSSKEWYDRFTAQAELLKQVNERAAGYEKQRDNTYMQINAERETRARLEAEREHERGYIEGLLDRQHPERPRLPWEPWEPANGLERTTIGGISHERQFR